MNQRKLKRQMRRAQGVPEKNALAPKGTTGQPKGPAQVSRAQYVAIVKARAAIRKAKRAAQVKRAIEKAAA